MYVKCIKEIFNKKTLNYDKKNYKIDKNESYKVPVVKNMEEEKKTMEKHKTLCKHGKHKITYYI